MTCGYFEPKPEAVIQGSLEQWRNSSVGRILPHKSPCLSSPGEISIVTQVLLVRPKKKAIVHAIMGNLWLVCKPASTVLPLKIDVPTLSLTTYLMLGITGGDGKMLLNIISGHHLQNGTLRTLHARNSLNSTRVQWSGITLPVRKEDCRPDSKAECWSRSTSAASA